MEKKYKYSELLDIQTKHSYAILSNIISKEQFKISLKSANVINYLQSIENFTYQNLKTKFYQIDENELNKFFEFLKVKRFIHELHDDPKILTIKTAFSLFNYEIKDFFTVKNSTVFLGIPFGKGNTVDRETSMYPDKIRSFTAKYGINGDISRRIYDVGNIFFYENEYSFISYKKIEKIIDILSNNNNKIFSLGGDHSITFPIVKSLTKKNKKINIIHFDAHTDCYKSSIHDLYEKYNFCSHHHGNFLEKTIELENVNKVYQFGMRALKTEKKHPSNKIEIFKNIEFEEFINNINYIDRKIPIYITFDIDIIDPYYAPATATPVIDGVKKSDMFYIIDKLKESDLNIIGVDIVEVNPSKDIGGVTMQLSVQLIQKLLRIIK